MKKSTPSFVTEIPLIVTQKQKSILNKRFEAARQVYNACLSEALKRLDLMRESKDWYAAKKLKGKLKTQAYKELDMRFGFSKYSLQSYAKQFGHSWLGYHLDSQTVKQIAVRAFTWVKEYTYDKKRGRPKFKRYNSLNSVESINNTQGIIWRDNQVIWNSGRKGKKLFLDTIIDTKSPVTEHGLDCRVKYVRLVRRNLNGRQQFYAQLVNEGIPFKRYKMGKGLVGLDLGPSTIACVGDDKVFLEQFCSQLENKQKKVKLLQRKVERQKRANNPDNFNLNGTIKKGIRLRWVTSNHQKRTSTKLAELKRKEADYRKSLHGQLVNRIIQMGDVIKLEKLSYVAFQKMFGKSVGKRAPGMFVAKLRAKVNTYGGLIDEFSTYKTKFSQLCHGCGKYVKKPLSQRWHKCECGIEGQRDLYSAFLATCAEDDTFNKTLADARWENTRVLMEIVINDLKYVKSNPSSFGV